jgi:hypothetical protein
MPNDLFANGSRILGVFTTALINLSIAMESSGFRGLATALLIFLLLIYFYNLFFTLYRVYTGVALGIPQEREREQQQSYNGHSAGDDSVGKGDNQV